MLTVVKASKEVEETAWRMHRGDTCEEMGRNGHPSLPGLFVGGGGGRCKRMTQIQLKGKSIGRGERQSGEGKGRGHWCAVVQ